MLPHINKTEIYRIPGKMIGHHLPAIDTIVDTWTDSLFVSLEDWKSTVFDIGISNYAPKNGIKNWIIDTSQARSVFPPAIQEFREKIAKPELEKNGVRRLFVVLPSTGIGKFSAAKTAELYDGDQGLQGFDIENIEKAFDIINKDL